MNGDQFAGILRTILPTALAYAVGKGWISAGSVGDISAAILAVAAAGWSVYTNSLSSKAAAVAGGPGTTVSPDGKTIVLVDPKLSDAAKAAATDISGK